MIYLNNISKFYGHKVALDGLTLSIDSPGLYGLLGINGAGKTTTIRCICGLTSVTKGTVKRCIPTNAIGYMPEELALYRDMSVRSNLLYFCDILGLDPKKDLTDTMQLVTRLGLQKDLDTCVGKLSKGNIRKVQFLCTTMHQPKLLILDEPFSGLDPISTEIMIQELTRQKKRGVAVLLSTHRIEQAEKICDHIFLVHKGKVLIDAPKQSALTDKDNPMMFEVTTLSPIKDTEEFHLRQCIGETYTYWVSPSKINHPALVDAFQKS